MKLSVIIPVYNGEKTIDKLVKELINSLKHYKLEIVLVNDGSTDKSHEVCVSIFNKFRENVKYIYLARNFGEHNAVMAGLNNATGDYTVIIDDDFQNPPGEIQKLVDVAKLGRFDVVYGHYEDKRHSAFRNLGSRFNNSVANFLLEKPRDLYLSSFKCMNRFIIREVVKYKGPFPYIDGLILRSTRNVGKALVKHDDRKEGKSGYTIRKLVRLWINMFINFSVLPLRVGAFVGFFCLIFGIFSSVYLIIEKFINPNIPRGTISILLAILVFGGIQLLLLGLLGEYLGKMFLANNKTPQYAVRETFIGDSGNAGENKS